MAIDLAIRAALEAAEKTAAGAALRDLSGGCIHRVFEVTLADGSRLVAKTNQVRQLKLFEEEAHGLRALAATKTVLTPQPFHVGAASGTAVLLMTAIDPPTSRPTEKTWRNFGADLAALHRTDSGARYGFEFDNHIGSTIQPNGWHDDWVEFNAANRLGFQLSMASESGLLDRTDAMVIQAVIDRLDQLIPRHPKPALLHGDLWSGNALPAAGDRIAVIDPACSIGDGWADIAMMRLFGGFPESCFDAYAANVEDRHQIEDRIAVYQLYHVLNHVNIFGRGYAGQALSLARRLGG